jgi:hypothetical protein
MAAFVLKLSEIQQRSPCMLDAFKTAKRGRDANGDLVYPQGFTSELLHDLAIRVPIELLWLLGNGLIPATRADVFAAIKKAHGEDGLSKIRTESRLRFAARQGGKAPEATTKGKGARSTTAARRPSANEPNVLPTLDEYVKAGYDAKNYQNFIDSHLKEGGWKLPDTKSPESTTTKPEKK